MAGLLPGVIAAHVSLPVTVSATRVVLTIQDEQREFACNEICDLNSRRLVSTFLRHGYSRAEGTPDSAT